MEPKRIYPFQSITQIMQSQNIEDEGSDYSDFQFPKKKIKLNQFQSYIEDEENQNFQIDQEQDNIHRNNLYEDELQNLGALSFKTMSKIGFDKFNSINKIQLNQNQIPSSSSRQKIHSNVISQQKIKSHSKNSCLKPSIIPYCSMNQIQIQKRFSIQQKAQKKDLKNSRRLSISDNNGGSMGSININTQVINDMMDFNVKEEDQIEERDLKFILQSALIKNIIFTANLNIFNLQNHTNSAFSTVKCYKIIATDGFSITGFYASQQKFRINLTDVITNKQFQKKYLFKQQSRCDYGSKQQENNNLYGKIYNKQSYEWQNIKFALSQIRYNQVNESKNRQQRQNINIYQVNTKNGQFY